MNRQALAFLTMFSLILMLSVYYVTLPSDTASVMSTENGEDLSQGKQDTSKEEVSDVEKLQQEIQQKNDEEVKKNSEVVSSTDASEAQKNNALKSIDTLKSDKALMQSVQQALADAKFMAAVEITSGTCKVSVFEQEDTVENAQAVMKIASAQTTNKFLVEVSFK